MERKEINPPIPPLQGPILSKADKRKLRNPPPVVTPAERESQREERRELRKYMRMIKSTGKRGKVRREMKKRGREEMENMDEYSFEAQQNVASAHDEDVPKKKKQRLEDDSAPSALPQRPPRNMDHVPSVASSMTSARVSGGSKGSPSGRRPKKTVVRSANEW